MNVYAQVHPSQPDIDILGPPAIGKKKSVRGFHFVILDGKSLVVFVRPASFARESLMIIIVACFIVAPNADLMIASSLRCRRVANAERRSL